MNPTHAHSAVDKSKTARALYDQGYNCAQAVVGAYAEDFGLDRQKAFEMACGFGGGLGRMGETCGALTGAVLVLGLKFGNAETDRGKRDVIYGKVSELLRAFEQRHGSCRCKDLLGIDISTGMGWSTARAINLFRVRCPLYVEEVARMLDRQIEGGPAGEPEG